MPGTSSASCKYLLITRTVFEALAVPGLRTVALKALVCGMAEQSDQIEKVGHYLERVSRSQIIIGF